jgi:hypothetical protein
MADGRFKHVGRDGDEMRHWRLIGALAAVLFVAAHGEAAEPNETFATRTILSSGVLAVSDELTPGLFDAPDTLLGIRAGVFGDIAFVDDDGSPIGNGFASGVGHAPVESGTIRFAVSGTGDDFFEGHHVQSGQYEVFVDVYDSFDDLIDTIRETRTLQPGMVDEYTFSDAEYFNADNYDVYIDNTVGGVSGGDVDFFTFTGLTPGAMFTAQTLDPTSAHIDTILGQFNSIGPPIQLNDDDPAGGLLSLLTGVVPSGGTLTFAVSGTGDDAFTGNHIEQASYQLKLTLAGAFAADFNDDGHVTGADLAVWQGAFDASVQGDADHDGDSDGADFLIWQRELGSGATSAGAAAAVPEPVGWEWIAAGTAAGAALGPRRAVRAKFAAC